MSSNLGLCRRRRGLYRQLSQLRSFGNNPAFQCSSRSTVLLFVMDDVAWKLDNPSTASSSDLAVGKPCAQCYSTQHGGFGLI